MAFTSTEESNLNTGYHDDFDILNQSKEMYVIELYTTSRRILVVEIYNLTKLLRGPYGPKRMAHKRKIVSKAAKILTKTL